MALSDMGGVRHGGHGPLLLRLSAHSVLHAVHGGVQVVAVLQKRRQLRVVRSAP
jgi:hypothetical protein